MSDSNRWAVLGRLGLVVFSAMLGAAPHALAANDDAVDEAALRNPLPYTKAIIADGKALYLRHCQTCHGYDGRALDNADFQAADLTTPEVWSYGSEEDEIFKSIKEGAGLDMPPFARQFEDDEIWKVVHFLRSIGPEDLRPELAEDEASAAEASAADSSKQARSER